MVLNIGPENRIKIKKFIENYSISRVKILAYYLGLNSLVERIIRTLKDILLKLINRYTLRSDKKEHSTRWRSYFYATLITDRITVNTNTGISLYFFIFRSNTVIPVELEMPI